MHSLGLFIRLCCVFARQLKEKFSCGMYDTAAPLLLHLSHWIAHICTLDMKYICDMKYIAHAWRKIIKCGSYTFSSAAKNSSTGGYTSNITGYCN